MKCDDYLCITNKDGKKWILPKSGLKTAECLYQPSSLKGKALKTLLPVINCIPVLRKPCFDAIGIQDEQVEISSEIDKEVRSVFHFMSENRIEYAFFCGTPGKHMKTTVQIASNGKIFGYIKVSNKPDVINLFRHEERVLKKMEICHVSGVPHCLCCKEIGDGVFMFIQDTVKTKNSTGIHELTILHYRFLDELYKKTKIECDFNDSDYGRMLIQLEDKVSQIRSIGFSLENEEQIREAINIVRNSLKKSTIYSLYHGDFTPWNMFLDKNKLFVFDFEYASFKYPPYLDIFHFIIQTAIYERHYRPDKIIRELERKYWRELKKVFKDPLISFLSYLLSSIYFYIEREKMKFDERVQYEIQVRIELVKIIMNNLRSMK